MVLVEDQIEIERSGGAWMRALSPEALLDCEQAAEQIARIEGGFPHRGGIEKPRLRVNPNRLGIVKRRCGEAGDEAGDFVERADQRRVAIAEVAAQGDGYSSQRVDSTPPWRATPPVRRPSTSSLPAAA